MTLISVSKTWSVTNSSEMEDQIAIMFSDVMDKAMSIVQAEEAAAAAASSSTRRSKRSRCYINRDHEAAHFRLWHDYFDNDYVYPHHTSAGGIVFGGLFSKHYA
jgi:hypothetical protein